ncbi:MULTISPECIES: DUF502 domain-containing protein [unclassified Neochlamydia]|uniref:DUF502 domain-containing protein n=1 Tax=unclassified Neochlamydia TaxID=2643326 RepID=UPI0014079C38|nr:MULTISPECIES: DUF502 domain-containing protein [unclassified Neochlamydia]MBS4166652.1 Uncharacterized protein [Neochlamydia sp. AcF65]NGY95071.1 hypothetical protein [Neochlamydia sp. AcF84]
MKKYFLTGLALLLPVIFTLAIVAFIVNLLTDPFIHLLKEVFHYYQPADDYLWNLDKTLGLLIIIRLFILIMVVIFIIFIGFLTRTFFMYSLLSFTDNLIRHIPIINKVYKSLQDVIHPLFSSTSSSFKQVVLVPYPHENSLSIGFLTSNTLKETSESKLKGKIAIFVPGTPNPTFGFILMFPPDKVRLIDMKVEDAFKLLVSCGIMLPSMPGVSDHAKT